MPIELQPNYHLIFTTYQVQEGWTIITRTVKEKHTDVMIRKISTIEDVTHTFNSYSPTILYYKY